MEVVHVYFILRTLKYLKKKIGKTILIGVIFLLIANFVLAGLLIREASNKAQEQTMLSLGADINYSIAWDQVIESVNKGEIERSVMGQIKSQERLIESEFFTEYGGASYKNITLVADSELVLDYSFDVSFTSFVENVDEFVLDETARSQSLFTIKLFDHGVPTAFNDNMAKISEGRMISDSEHIEGQKVALISEEVANANGLKVGDSIEIEYDLVDNNLIKIAHEIVGIYTTDEEASQQAVQSSSGSSLPQNSIYVPYTILTEVGYNDEQINNIWLGSNVISLKDPSTIDEFIREAESKVNLKFGVLETNEDLYDSLVGPIEIIGDISNYAVMVILLTGGLIIGLITALTVNERKGEIGILLAVGETKFKIVSQFVMEVVIIAVITFGFSIFTGGLIGDVVSDSALSSELFENTETDQSMEIVNKGAKRGAGKNIESKVKSYEEDASIDISLNMDIILLLFGLGITLSIVSTIIPALYVMRFNPKQILSNRTS